MKQIMKHVYKTNIKTFATIRITTGYVHWFFLCSFPIQTNKMSNAHRLNKLSSIGLCNKIICFYDRKRKMILFHCILLKFYSVFGFLLFTINFSGLKVTENERFYAHVKISVKINEEKASKR